MSLSLSLWEGFYHRLSAVILRTFVGRILWSSGCVWLLFFFASCLSIFDTRHSGFVVAGLVDDGTQQPVLVVLLTSHKVLSSQSAVHVVVLTFH